MAWYRFMWSNFVSALVGFSIFTLGWGCGLLLGNIVFNGLSCSVGYYLVSGWCSALYIGQYNRTNFLAIMFEAVLSLTLIFSIFCTFYIYKFFELSDYTITEAMSMAVKYALLFESPRLVDHVINSVLSLGINFVRRGDLKSNDTYYH